MASAVPAFPSTKETTNYARLCRLLVDAGSHVLRERFDQIHSPAGLCSLLSNPTVHATLDSLHKKRVLNPSQWSKLYPVIKSSVMSVNFDITLLMVLLRSICGLTPPATGWDNLPTDADLTLEAEIARVKFYRNRVYAHASHTTVDDVTFSTCWKEISDTIVRLGGLPYGAVVDNLRYESMDCDIEDYYKELLKQWKVDEDNIKIKLEEVGEKLEELKASMDNLEGRRAPVASKSKQLQNPEMPFDHISLATWKWGLRQTDLKGNFILHPPVFPEPDLTRLLTTFEGSY